MNIAKLINSLLVPTTPLNLNTNIAIVKQEEKNSEDETKIFSLVNDFIINEKDSLEKLVNEFDVKKSAKQNLENILENNDEIFQKLLLNLKTSGIIYVNKEEEILSNTKIKTDFKKHLNSILLKSIKSIKKRNKEINTEAKSYYKRIITDFKNKFVVNDDGTESSKNVENTILGMKTLLNNIEDQIINKTALAERLLTASTVITGISIGTGLAAASLYALIPFTSGATSVPAAALSLATGILGSIASALKMAYYDVLKTIESFKEIEDTLSKYSFMTVTEMALKATSFSLSLFKLKYNIVKFDSLINPKSLSKVSAFIAPLISTKNLLEDIKELEEFKKFNNEIKEGSLELLKTISRLETIRWTVINETIIDKPYTQGGVGGANTHFKNLKTGEITTLEELLKLNDFELSINGLLRVKDPKKGEYLRTFPNKVKWDNLG
ncbi:hypothetical protein [Mycoplasmopsis arginini]|uniref:hypothetical protein n=1 Tax=Mycoplasmopsis arginini TaxID=2094 RepID=UPI00249EDD63|nr:hypothetical protein [Mycoplasmopsis arginini]MDI3351254.1 hypothetical protein [Mycoplasmopsis arginini]MDI3351798.1 hypothetical protein [Mycoplasmopsis arginini]